VLGGDQLVYRASDGVLLKKGEPFLWPSEEARKAAKEAAKAEKGRQHDAENQTAIQEHEQAQKAIAKPVDEDAAVRAVLKSNVFPAQVQFQGGMYSDENGNGVGEYGTLGQLAGREATGRVAVGSIRLAQPPIQKGDSAYGYTFIVHLPAQVADRERFFVAYAYPTDGSTKPVYALCHDGQVRVSPTPGLPDANALFGGADWSVAPKWLVYAK
jgi:hypothetical protein